MTKRRCFGWVCGGLLVAVGMAAWMAGCVVQVDGTDGDGDGNGDGGGTIVVAELKIGNTTLSLTLDLAGLFRVQPNAVVRNVVDAQPFDEAPTDAPATGAVRLRSSSIIVNPPETAKGRAAQQAITGTASLRVTIDAPGAISPCDTGVELGTFEITIANGTVTSVSGGLPLALASTAYFLDNNISMCLEMETDFDGTVQISGLDVVFGPSEDELLSGGLNGNFELRNLDTQTTHILAPNEEFDASNQLGAGIYQTKSITGLSILDLVTFRAGRNGTVLDTATCPPVNQADFYAVVEWDGTTLTCYQPTIQPDDSTEPEYEACCLPPLAGYEYYDETYAQYCAPIDGTLPYQIADDCRFFGGVPQGSGTTCETITCNEDFRACCFATIDSCSDLLYEKCVDLGGAPELAGVHCDSFPCDEDEPDPPPPPPADEACCLEDGSCQDADPVACAFAGGTSEGPGSTCAATTCPQPVVEVLGGCCFDDTVFCFGEISEDDCWATDGEPYDTCDPDPCLFACCKTDGTCTTGLSVEDCEAEEGTAYERGTTCDDVTCEQPPVELTWVLTETLVNTFDQPLDFVGGGAMPDWYPDARYEGKTLSYTITETSISMHDVQVDHGFEFWNVTLQTDFGSPPTELIPGETVTLVVNASGSGTVSEGWSPWLQFWFSSDDVNVDPAEVLAYSPWSPTFDGISSKTYTFTVPQANEGQTIEVYAGWWNCPPCQVLWRYQAE